MPNADPALPTPNARLQSASQAIESSQSAMIVTDPNQPDNPIVAVNEAFCRLTGYDRGEILGRNCRFLQGPETHADAVAVLRRAVAAGASGAATLLNYGKGARPFLNSVQIIPIREPGGELLFFVGSQFEVPPLEIVFPVAEEWTFNT